jgi:hypothetical protein
MSEEGNATLAQAIKELTQKWEQTKAYWRDVKADEFEHNYLERLPNLTARTAAAMDEIGVLLRKVHNDCE